MEMTYKRKRFTNKIEYAIWSFDRRGPKGAPRIFARCSKCSKVNDVTTGIFLAQYVNGKCTTAQSGCQACVYCGRPFNEWVFERWLPSFSFITTDLYTFGGKSTKEITKAVERVASVYKGRFYAYLCTNILGIGAYAEPGAFTPARSGQVVFDAARQNWVMSTNMTGARKTLIDFDEAVDSLLEYLNGGAFIKSAAAATVI